MCQLRTAPTLMYIGNYRLYETSVVKPNPSGLGYKTAKTLTQKLKCSIIQCNLLDNTLTLHACAGVVHHCQRWIKQVAKCEHVMRNMYGSSP